MENDETRPSLGQLIVLPPRQKLKTRAHPAHSGVIVQLLSIRDDHPQWREIRREDGVIAAHKYAAQLKDFSAPHNSVEL
jgi:hypothetical protein